MRSCLAFTLASFVLGCSRSPSERSGPAASASFSAAPGAATAGDGLDVPRNGLCPGPCRWVLDRGADGTIDAAATFAYHPDGRVATVAIDRDGDGNTDSTFAFHYRRPKSGDAPPNGDHGAWGGLVLDTVTPIKNDRASGPVIDMPYWRGLLFDLPEGAPYEDVGKAGLDRNRRLAYAHEQGRPNEPGCAFLTESMRDETADRVLLLRRFLCDKGMRTGVDVVHESGALLATVRYDYSCWGPEKGCPATAAVAPAPAPVTSVEVCRADVQAAARALDLKRPHALGEHSPLLHPTKTRDGQIAMRLTGLRQDTALGRLGVRTGDVLSSFGGVKWGPDGALPVLAAGVDAKERFDIEVVRANQPLTIHVRTTEACAPRPG
jgi:hypothetical protein